MEWNQDLILKLIAEYKSSDVLWDPKHSAYYNKQKKEDAWIGLSKKIGKGVNEIKKKIESLKGSYRREKTRMKKKTRIGKGHTKIYESRWFAFTTLQFLDDRVEQKADSNSEAVFEDKDREGKGRIQGGEASTVNEFHERFQGSEQINDTQMSFEPPKKSLRRKKRTDEEDSSKISDAFAYLKQITVLSQQKDQCTIFGDYIASKLRSFDNCKRAIAQNRISNILFELEMDPASVSNSSDYRSYKTPHPFVLEGS